MALEEHLHRNLEHVFSERDPARRIAVIREIYAEDADLHEPHGSVRGHEAINDAVTALLSQMPPEVSFTAVRPALLLGDIARLQWRSGAQGSPAAVTGTDVARFADGRIAALYVFVDQQDG